MEGIAPEDLTINALVARVRGGGVREVVLALNPTLDGDGTALHIHSLLREFDVVVARPARGLAVGSQLEYATAGMLEAVCNNGVFLKRLMHLVTNNKSVGCQAGILPLQAGRTGGGIARWSS